MNYVNHLNCLSRHQNHSIVNCLGNVGRKIEVHLERLPSTQIILSCMALFRHDARRTPATENR